MIRVNDIEVELRKGITIKDAIKIAGLHTGVGIIVMVDGKVMLNEELTQEVERETHIKVMILVSGG